MTHKSHHGFGGSQTDQERAKLRGKGKEPTYRPGSDEDRNYTYKGQRGENVGLKGHALDPTLDDRLRIQPAPPRELE